MTGVRWGDHDEETLSVIVTIELAVVVVTLF